MSSASESPAFPPGSRGIPAALFAATILLSAFLLFQVQPLIAKLILPWFGGSAAVWTSCMLFFQMALLAGYAYAHWLNDQPDSRQTKIHASLLALSFFSLPILPSARWKPTGIGDPLLHILGLLTATVGLPYFLLSSTSPLLQTWYSRANGGAMPYRFFALSNAGSMAGLLAYPVLVEPYLTGRQQAWTWTIGYGTFAVVCATVAWMARRYHVEAPAAAVEAGPAPSWPERLLWMGLAGCASALLLAVTNHLTQNVAAIPFLWVLPLSLYLLSFILCFDSDRWYDRWLLGGLGALSLPGMAYSVSENGAEISGLAPAIAIFCSCAFLLFMVCHGELARRRPAARYLTSFYLMVSVGGAAGGLLIAFAAPYLFNALYDLPVVISLTGFVLTWLVWRENKGAAETRPPVRASYQAAIIVAAVGAALGYGGALSGLADLIHLPLGDRLHGAIGGWAGFAVGGVFALVLTWIRIRLAEAGAGGEPEKPTGFGGFRDAPAIVGLGGLLIAYSLIRFVQGQFFGGRHFLSWPWDTWILLSLTALLVVYSLWRTRGSDDFRLVVFVIAFGIAFGISGFLARDTRNALRNSRVLARNFYGALVVYDSESDGAMGPYRILRHGTIDHGEQFLWPQNQRYPTTYYAHGSGVGLAIETLQRNGPMTVGVIGLGAGTLTTYARKEDHYVVYDINPLVLKIAHTQFTFLDNCLGRHEVVMGDARLSLESEPSQQFDVLAVDAFSGDAIPVHLLTREAYQLYWRHLKPDGVLAVHVSNRYLDLGPVVAMGAAEMGKTARMVNFETDDRNDKEESDSDWVLVTSRPGFFDQPELKVAHTIKPIAGLRMWTDDYSNLYKILR